MPNHLSKRSITIWFGKSDAYINRPRSSLFAWPHQNTRNMTRNILGDRETQSFRSFPLPYMKEMKVKPAPWKRCDLNHSFIRSTMSMPHSYHPMTSIICTKLIKCGPLFLSGFFLFNQCFFSSLWTLWRDCLFNRIFASIVHQWWDKFQTVFIYF